MREKKNLPPSEYGEHCVTKQRSQCVLIYAKILLLIPFYRKRLLPLCQILPYVCNLSK